MDSETWYLGPVGDLRPLACPEEGISVDLIRYGGIHQALSGSRTMDVTGHKYEFRFEWEYLEKSEWSWLEALHTRIVPGPFWLLNPMRTNLLSRDSSISRVSVNSGISGASSSGSLTLVPNADFPALGMPGRSLKAVRTSDGEVYFDRYRAFPVIAGEPIRASVYAKAVAVGTGANELVLRFYDPSGVQVGSSYTASLTASTSAWGEAVISQTTPVGAVTGSIHVGMGANAQYLIAAPSVQMGSAFGPWEIGGAATLVSIDQLSTTSPRYSYMNCSMSLLEV
jgi:hypothetical protein